MHGSNAEIEVLETLTLDEFVSLCKEMKRVSKRKQQWLSLIKAGKLTCPVRGLEVDHVRLNKKTNTKGFSFHYDFYSACGQMFSVDHIIPKSRGGSHMDVNNLQPMLAVENQKKGSTIY